MDESSGSESIGPGQAWIRNVQRGGAGGVKNGPEAPKGPLTKAQEVDNAAKSPFTEKPAPRDRSSRVDQNAPRISDDPARPRS